MKLTHEQKLLALSLRFYQGLKWTPEAGHFYTTSRADLDVYEVVKIENGTVFTRYTENSTGGLSEWQEDGFLTDGFGPKRVWVPPFIMEQGQ